MRVALCLSARASNSNPVVIFGTRAEIRPIKTNAILTRKSILFKKKDVALLAHWECEIANESMSDLRIEPATLDDLSELTELLHDLFTQEADFTPDREKQLRGLRLILEQPSRGRIFVIRNERMIVGMINLLITISTAEGGFVLVLEDLVIHRDHRNQGFGSRLLNHALDFARQKKFLRITLLTDKGEQARPFYLKHGFSDSAMCPMRYVFVDEH